MKIAVGIATVFAIAQLAASSAFAKPYEEATVSDGGSIEGKVTYNGKVPEKTVLPTKDKEVCGGPRKEPRVVVGSGGEVKEVVVHLKEVAKGKSWPKQEPQKNPQINNKDCIFEPHVQVIRPGAFDIVNSDPVLHNTHGYYGTRTAFNVGLPIQGASVTRQLRRPGLVRVDCDAHGWMEGWTYVVANPYYAITGEDGTFKIDGVPPGDYTLVVWQEYVGSTEMPVSVKAKETTQVPVELKK